MDDLQLAVETVLLNYAAAGDTITFEASSSDSVLSILIGPVGGLLGNGARRREPALDLDRLLGALVERIEVFEREGETWLRLEKPIPSPR
jgi:hypothetical protein